MKTLLRTRKPWLCLCADSRFTYGELAGLYTPHLRMARPENRRGARVRSEFLPARTLEAYAGVLGTLWSGAAYVPIKPDTPEDRVIRILQQTKLDALIVDQAGLNRLSNHVLENAPKRILFGPDAKPAQSALEFEGTSFECFSELSDREGA